MKTYELPAQSQEEMAPAKESPHPRRVISILSGLLAIALCLYALVAAGKVGLSRLFTRYGLSTNLQEPLRLAVELTPSDPSAHYSRGVILEEAGQPAEAVREYERAIALRPHSFLLWRRLGLARDQANDERGAIEALYEAVRLAPFYSAPRWQLGNVLFRSGRYEEGFTEMRRAVASDSDLLPNFIDLVWSAYRGDVNAIEQVIRPDRDEWRLALAKFYAKQGKPADAVRIARQISSLEARDRQQFVTSLITAKQFADAYDIWASGVAEGQAPRMPTFINGSFEDRISFNEQTFGWRLNNGAQHVAISLDGGPPRSGQHSLRVDFNGESAINPDAVSQVVLTEPNTRYQIRFSFRTEQIVSGGLPVIAVIDLGGTDNRVLCQSKPLPPSTNGWAEGTCEFTAGAATRAVKVNLQREPCSSAPCPAFGRVWLDDFVIRKAD